MEYSKMTKEELETQLEIEMDNLQSAKSLGENADVESINKKLDSIQRILGIDEFLEENPD